VLLVAISAALESTSIVFLIPSSIPPILIVLDLVLDTILVRNRATKGGTTKYGKVWA
jgi:hypothetical protein